MHREEIYQLLLIGSEGEPAEQILSCFANEPNFHLDLAPNGSEAKRMLLGKSYDLILAGSDGQEPDLFEEIRRLDPEVPVTMLTGKARDGQTAESMKPDYSWDTFWPLKNFDLLPKMSEITIREHRIGKRERQVEAALEEREKGYLSFFQNFRGIAYRSPLGPRSVPKFIHGAVEEITGYAAEEFLSGDLNWQEVVHPDDLPQLMGEMERMCSVPDCSIEREYRIVRKEGTVRWVHELVRNLSDESCKPREVEGTMYDVTDRKKAEGDLQKSKERYQAIVQYQTELICRALPDGTLTFVNDAYCLYFGMDHEDLVGRSFTDLIPKTDQELVRRHISSLSEKSPLSTCTHRMILPTGELRWQQWTNRAIFDEEGRIVEIQSVGRDVTEQKKMETALKESEEILNLAAEGADLGVWNWDVISGEVVGNGRYAEMIDLHPKVLKSDLETWKRLMHPDDRDRVEAAIQDVLDKKTIQFEEDYRLKLRAGSQIWIHDRGEVVAWDGMGHPVKMAGVMQDVTDRKLAEETLRENEEKLRLERDRTKKYLELAAVIFLVLDKDGVVKLINRKGCCIVGCSSEEVVGKNWFDHFVSERVRDGVKTAFRNLVEGDIESIEYFENPILTGDGKERTILWHNAILEDPEGGFICVISSGEDVTDRRRAEEDLRYAHQRLMDIIDFLPDATFVIDRDKRVIAWNRAIENMTGVSKVEVVGKGDYAYSVPLYGTKTPALVDLVFSRDDALESRYDYVKRLDDTVFAEIFLPTVREGEGAYIWIKASPIFDGQGEVTGAIQSVRDITERKQVEEHLKQLADISEKLIRVSNPMLCVIDRDKKILIWNRAAEEVTGYKAKDVTGKKDLWNLLLPDTQTRAKILETLGEIEKGRTVSNQVTKIRTESGEDRTISWNGLSLEDCTGKVVGVVITGQDVTEQLKMEEVIRSEREFSRSIIEGANLLIAGMEPEGEIVLFNKGAEILTGYSSEEVLGKDFFDLLIPDALREAFRDHVESITEGESEEQMEGLLLTKLGAELTLQWSWSVVRDDSGEPERLIAFGQDISYDRWLEDQMLLFMDAIESSNDGIAIFDKTGHLLFANPAALEMYGFSLYEVRGSLYSDFIMEAEEIAHVAVEDDGWRGPVTGIRKDGSTFPASVSIAPVTGRDRQFNAIVTVIRDISQAVEYERKLESLNRELESFAYTISHDLRAPLRGIRGFTDVLLEDYSDQLDEAGRRYLERVGRISAEMDRLILDLLDYSRIGRIVAPPEELDLKRLVAQAYEEVRSLAGCRDVRFSLEGDFPMIKGERSRIKQIFTNLLANSLKYTGDEPAIEVECADLGNRYEFCVRDNGQGFEMEYKDRIFEPFIRLERSGEGTGIGLATVKKIVETYGGKIWVESEPGKGSTFHFTLPKRRD